jgi:hypothetical protein
MPANNIDQPINVFVGIGEQEAISFGNQYDMVNDAKVFIKTINHIHGSKVNSKLLVIPEADHYTAFPTTAVQGIDWIYRVK